MNNTFHYLLNEVTWEEKQRFHGLLTYKWGTPMRWFACCTDGVIVECESRVQMVSWRVFLKVVSPISLAEMQKIDDNINDLINENKKKYDYEN